MANITLNNPSNISSAIQLGISEASLDNKTIAVALTSFLNTVRVGYADVKQELSTSPLSAWVVTSVETLPAPTAANAGATTQVVHFQNGTRELILDGALSNAGSTFILAVSGMRMVGADYDFGLALSPPAAGAQPWTIKFVQEDSGKTYENQLEYYNGQVTQPATTVGALPIGAKLTDIGGTPKVNAVPASAGKPAVPEVPADLFAKLPTSFTEVTLDIDKGESSLALGGSFNINKSTGALTGTLRTLQDVFEPDGGLGLAVRTFNVTNGSIASTSSSATLGMFSPTAPTALPSIQLVNEQQTDDTASFNFGSKKFVFPAQGTSTTTYTYVAGETALLLGGTDVSQLELGAFAGNDTITVTSNTDVTIFAGAGNDTVNAGSGNNIIYGGKGNDVLNGEAGNDLFVVNHMGAEGASINQSNPTLTASQVVTTVTNGVTSNVTYTYKTTLLNGDVINGGSGNDVLSFDSLPGNLQLIQPAQWAARVGGATGPGPTVDSYVTANGVFGKLVSTSGNERTYGEIKAPATDSIGFVFKNSEVISPAIQDEYVQVKNVEYLEIETDGARTTYDIRPLYLATTGADTMFAFTRQAFDDLVGVLDLGTSTGDPLSWYRNQFSVVQYEGTGKEWRYYVNSGSGDDTLYGTRDLDTETTTDLITLGNSIVKESLLTLNLTKGSVTKSISIDVDAKDSSGAFLYLDAQSNVDFGKINTKLVAELNNVNVGISAQRFNDNLKVVVSGLEESGWTLASSSNLVTVKENTDEKIFDRGRDLLDGGVGADTMIGYGGSDSYYVDNVADQVIESGWHSGFDVVMVSAPAPTAATQPAFTYTLQADSAVERLQVHQIIAGDNGNLFGEPRATAPTSASTAVNLRGNNFTYEFLGHDGANTITAGQFSGITPRLDPTGGALLMGMGGKDSLVGGDLNDHFFGGADADTLQGGAGNDSFYMGFTWSGTRITDLLLPEQYKLLRQLDAYDRPDFLSGGDDVAIGGAGYDVVVVGLDLNDSPFASQLSFQRVTETQIKISTVTESITVDSSVEAVRFYDGKTVNEVRLPWIVDERARDLYYSTEGTALSASANISPSNAYVPASEFADFMDLNSYPLQSSTVSSIDAGKGNDIVYGSRDGSAGVRTIRGGEGNDWVYGWAFVAESIADRYELYGNAGDDTITLDASSLQGGVDNIAPRVLLDGGAGSDHYRVSLSDVSTTSAKTNIRIADSGGAPTPTAADKNTDKITFTSPSSDDNFSMQWMWEGNELRLLRIERAGEFFSTSVYLAANVGTIEQMFVTGDDLYFSADLFGGNLVNPNAAAYASGILRGGDGADVLLAISGMTLNYDGGAGDDLIILNGFTGGVATGGLGNNRILVDDYIERNPVHSLSYAWTAVGHTAEIDLSSGYSFVTVLDTVTKNEVLVASDRFETGYFANVLGGAGNETIKGSDTANRIDGGAGDDILFSGQNALTQASPEVSDWRSIQPPLAPVRDVLIGGAGNDILVEEAHWGSSWEWNQQQPQFNNIGSLLDGGAGNDVYVLQHNGAPAGWVTPTRIVERNSNTEGGLDTIRFATSEEGTPSYSFVQTGNTVRVTSSAFDDIVVGDTFLAAFNSGSTLTNIYTVSALIKDADSNVTGFEFLAPSSVLTPQSGTLGIVMDPTIDGMGVWADANTFALFSPDGANQEALDAVQDGKGMIEDFDGNSLISELPVQALIDRNAMDFMELGTADPLVAGVRLPVSFNVGKSAGLEVVMAGANGDAFLYGGAGTDMIMDSAWNDVLIGGNGQDVLSSHFGQDILLGGAGNDTLRYRADGQVLVGGAGADSFVLRGLGDAPATVTDFKPWEGDKLILDSDWLDEFIPDGGKYSVTNDPWVSSDDHITFKLNYDWDQQQNKYLSSVEFLNVSISADHDRAFDQVDVADKQLNPIM